MDFSTATLLYLFLGGLVGITLGITGSGGGIIAIPVLVYFFHLPLREAIPISLMTVCISAYLGSYIGFKNNLLRWRAALYMFLVGLITIPAGLYLANHLPEYYLLIMFLALVVAGIVTMIQKIQNKTTQQNKEIKDTLCKLTTEGRFIWNKATYSAMGIVGIIIGFFSGLLGVAGGFVVIPALSKISKLSIEAITATSLGVVALFGTSTILLSAANGHVNWNIGIWFSLGGCLGMIIGRKISLLLTQRTIQTFYIFISFFTAAGILVKIAIS